MKKAILASALAVAASGVFAQAAVQSSTNVTVTSGTGVVVTPGVSGHAMVDGSVQAVAVLPKPTIDGAVVAQAGSSESVNGNTKVVTTRYWVNVPPGANVDDEFERWQRLK
jgi:hypothetical protein